MRLHVPPHPHPTAPRIRGVLLSFAPSVEMDQVRDTLELARMAGESLHGAERVQLEAWWEVEGNTVAVDTSMRSGRTVAIVFLGLVRREFGDAAVTVRTGVAR